MIFQLQVDGPIIVFETRGHMLIVSYDILFSMCRRISLNLLLSMDEEARSIPIEGIEATPKGLLLKKVLLIW